MQKKKMYRQGDVLFIEISGLPKEAGKATEQKNPVLVEGEATGHAHRVESLDTAHIFAISTLLYVQAVRETHIVHDEHDTIILPPGNYQVVRQREYVAPDEGNRSRPSVRPQKRPRYHPEDENDKTEWDWKWVVD